MQKVHVCSVLSFCSDLEPSLNSTRNSSKACVFCEHRRLQDLWLGRAKGARSAPRFWPRPFLAHQNYRNDNYPKR